MARLCPEAYPGYSKGRHTRTVLTAVGLITLERIYFRCPVCKQGDFGADRILGVEGYVTRGACRMACLLGVQQSFTRAQRALAEVKAKSGTQFCPRCVGALERILPLEALEREDDRARLSVAS